MQERGIGTIYGQPGTFKSFLLMDLLAAIANGPLWFERKVMPRPTVYIPFEGKGALPSRVEAWRKAHMGTSTNMRFITHPINLRKAEDRNELVEILVEQKWGVPPVLAIDTLAAAAGSFDENSSKDMGAMIEIIQELQQRLDGFVLAVHHSGKDPAKGMRGHSSLHGAADLEIECFRAQGDDKYGGHFRLAKVKDGEDGAVFDFCMTSHALGQDEDGDFITSLTVLPQQRVPATDAEAEAVLAIIRRECNLGNKPSQEYLTKNVPGVARDKVRAAVAKLVKDGIIQRVGKTGKYAWLKLVT